MQAPYFILLICLSPVFLIYAVMCATLPMIRLGATRSGGIRMHVAKDAIHSDYLFESELWSDMFEPRGKYVKIGWGDRRIFLETKSWSDFKVSDFLSAFFGLNGTVLRVDFLEEVPEGSSAIDINQGQLECLKKYVGQSHKGCPIAKESHHYPHGDYYQSDLKYNCITNCNNWVNRGLYLAGATNRLWCPVSFWL